MKLTDTARFSIFISVGVRRASPFLFDIIYCHLYGRNLIRPKMRNAHFLDCVIVVAFPATPQIPNMYFTYSLCAVKRRPRENRPKMRNAHFLDCVIVG